MNAEWNFDMSTAPKGKMVTSIVSAGKDKDGNPKTREVTEHVPDYIWAASACGKVIKSCWQPANKFHDGHFLSFASDPKYGSGPIAWQPFIVPRHPNDPGYGTGELMWKQIEERVQRETSEQGEAA